jgi:hypothetical protein
MKKSRDEYISKNPNSIYKKSNLTELGANQPVGTAGMGGGLASAIKQPTSGNTTPNTEPLDKKKVLQSINTMKSATGSTAPADKLAKAIDDVSAGKAVDQTTMNTIKPMMDVLANTAKDPQLANQFKNLANKTR